MYTSGNISSQKWSKIVKKLRLTLFGGPFFKVNFFQIYMSNEAQTKLKTLITIYIRPGEYIWLFAWANIKSYSPGLIYIWLFARANIYGYSPGRIYMVIRSGEYIWLFALANILESGYSPG